MRFPRWVRTRSLAVGLLLWGAPADAQPPPATDASCRITVKAGLLGTRAPDAPWLYPDRHSAGTLWRVRVEPLWHVNARWSIEGAYEQRAQAFSPAGSTASGIWRSDAGAPYRVTPLDRAISRSAVATWQHELDRAVVRWNGARVRIAIGRQAVGWGRGVLFSAADVFVPFTPVEADRETRRGLDAARAELTLGERGSLDVVRAFGVSRSQSILAARVRGYRGPADVEIMAGTRARDLFGGVTASIALGGAEWHGELVAFRTPAVDGSATFAAARTRVKAVIGASRRVPIGAGLLLDAEYHYSAFGLTDTAQAVRIAATDDEWSQRYLRGDTQILGRHAAAIVASYEWSPLVSTSGSWMHNPVDRSGMVMPAVTITPGDQWSLVAMGYLPYGRAPSSNASASTGSEFGLSPAAVFVQVRLHR